MFFSLILIITINSINVMKNVGGEDDDNDGGLFAENDNEDICHSNLIIGCSPFT